MRAAILALFIWNIVNSLAIWQMSDKHAGISPRFVESRSVRVTNGNPFYNGDLPINPSISIHSEMIEFLDADANTILVITKDGVYRPSTLGMDLYQNWKKEPPVVKFSR